MNAIVAFKLALRRAKDYVNGVALNGVPIRYPDIDPTTHRWMLFNPITNAYEDSGFVARGVSPAINIPTGTWLVWDDAAAVYVDSGVPVTGPKGEVAQFQTVGRMVQYRFATQAPTEWTDLYEFPVRPTFTHNQTTASDVWNIQHNLGSRAVNMFVVDTDGDQIIGQQDAQASTINLLVLRFSEPLTGTAYLNL